MEDFCISQGYPALFILSFFASTIVPLGSEWLLVTLVVTGYNPAVSIAIATCGNTMGAITTYWIGLYGSPFLMHSILRISEESRQKAEKIYARYGIWSLLFSWIPFIGDPLCMLGGILKIRLSLFSVLVCSGKFARYLAISFLAIKITGS